MDSKHALEGFMDDKRGAPSSWTFNRPFADLRAGTLSGRVDVTHPERGLHDIEADARKPAGRLLCVGRHAESATLRAPEPEGGPSWPLTIAEAYLRGDDLVASYQPADDWPYSPQIYWRANSLELLDGLFGSLSLLLSVQTHLLDTWPRIRVSSHVVCSEALLVSAGGTKHARTESLSGSRTFRSSTGACCIVRRLADVPLSYVEIMPASDFREVAIDPDDNGNCHVRWELFADFLEKGVIRRSRLQTAFLSRESDVALAAACCTAMEQRPLPLTT